MPSQRIKAGVARVVISPPKGIFLIGYGDRSTGNKGIHDDLTATALVLESDRVKIAIVALDILCLNEFIVDRVRAACPGIEPLLCCSHTHSGPIGYADEGSGRREKKYMDVLVMGIAEAIHQAAEATHEAELMWGQGSADIAINRREKLPSGEVIIGEDPAGVVDRSVGVLSVKADGKRLATVVNFACHGTVWGPDNLLVSADWIAAMREKVEGEIGGLCFFLQGAAGNLNPKMGWGREDCWEMAVSQGQRVGDAVLMAAGGRQAMIAGSELAISRQEVWIPFEGEAIIGKTARSLPQANSEDGEFSRMDVVCHRLSAQYSLPVETADRKAWWKLGNVPAGQRRSDRLPCPGELWRGGLY